MITTCGSFTLQCFGYSGDFHDEEVLPIFDLTSWMSSCRLSRSSYNFRDVFLNRLLTRSFFGQCSSALLIAEPTCIISLPAILLLYILCSIVVSFTTGDVAQCPIRTDTPFRYFIWDFTVSIPSVQRTRPLTQLAPHLSVLHHSPFLCRIFRIKSNPISPLLLSVLMSNELHVSTSIARIDSFLSSQHFITSELVFYSNVRLVSRRFTQLEARNSATLVLRNDFAIIQNRHTPSRAFFDRRNFFSFH